jgi:hypothetical protein
LDSDWGKRKVALEISSIYRLKYTVRSVPPLAFETGEEVVLIAIGYSHYDNSYVYTFETRNGSQKAFWLHDDDPLNRLTDVFIRVGGI